MGALVLNKLAMTQSKMGLNCAKNKVIMSIRLCLLNIDENNNTAQYTAAIVIAGMLVLLHPKFVSHTKMRSTTS